jgi:ABC-type uncharacterized transport system substrate-binding protein
MFEINITADSGLETFYMAATDKRLPVLLSECAVVIAGCTAGVGLATAYKFAEAG